MSMPPRRHPARVAAAVLAVAATLGLSACGGGSAGSSSAKSASSQGAADSAGGAAVGAPAKEGAVAGSDSSAAADPNVAKAAQSAASAQLLARTASMSIKVKDLNEAAARARGAALAAGGQVTQENIQTGSSPDPSPVPLGQEGTDQGTQQPQPPVGSANMILQVPGDKLDATLDTLSRIGTVAERQISTEDVTGQVVDTQARLATMKESVARVRALMSQATKLADIVTLESEVSRRQADLESLEAQLSSLNGRVAMSPITLTFWTTSPPATTEKKSTGFIGGLKSGWHAFTVATNVIVTAIGALLPFGILAAIVGIPLLAWSRKRRAARAVPPPPSAMWPPTDPNPPTDPPAPVDPTAPAPAEPVNA